jgi:hypothetical protein
MKFFFFPFEVKLNFFIEACLFLPLKNTFKNKIKIIFSLLQIKIFIFFLLNSFSK